jgi:phage terminase large subunit-like protein
MDSRIQVFASDDRTGDGVIPGGIAILDELHRHRDLKLYETWKGKLKKRDAQIIVISTAGEVGSEFEEERTAVAAGGDAGGAGGVSLGRRRGLRAGRCR